ncbi:Cof-type HAD-IIB family hydrolase [Lactobacillus hominis]|uniref:Phosphatase YidA n=1 Tax=Lactobacillus hominis DSM 23910 = CRBIP 24.179 TaxID=1423758 RepID=I7L7L9_9LACO|nr:Cof-type HAD-IIB family hydrolase [Lactobacillus hominis]KRM86216.1 had superfamily hydrolase [Lactobacillus hominis DSM 23910 = CRBIP 24.179]MCT3348561.1 Cof-type HAD-IIB family hydrolase [Lactobacillus hominis]CCI82717.1 Phosphatase YidA [Lactobacillus hominis DSM 23910 = CRBIP 24.179]
MLIKLIAVDLDGTLLNSEQKITTLTKEALQKAAAMGIKVVPCSGRPFPGVKEYLEELNLADKNQYAVTFNGALVFNLSGKVLVKELLNYTDLKYFYDLGQKYDMQFHFELEDRFVTSEHFLNYFMSRESWLTRMPIEVTNFEKIDQNIAFTKGMFSGSPDRIVEFLKQLPQELFEKYNVSTSDPTLVEINSLTASKGNALKELGQTLGIASEQIMIFGDQRNDLSMFNESGFHKVAMGNAIDEIKQKADFVTKTNDEDGIAYALGELVF